MGDGGHLSVEDDKGGSKHPALPGKDSIYLHTSVDQVIDLTKHIGDFPSLTSDTVIRQKLLTLNLHLTPRRKRSELIFSPARK